MKRAFFVVAVITALGIMPTVALANSDDDLWDIFHILARSGFRLESFDSSRHSGSPQITVTVRNDNPFPVKDFDIACELLAPSGTARVGALATFYEVVPAHSRKAFGPVTLEIIDEQTGRRVTEPDQVKSFSCSIGPFASVVKLGDEQVRTAAQLLRWCHEVRWTRLCPN